MSKLAMYSGSNLPRRRVGGTFLAGIVAAATMLTTAPVSAFDISKGPIEGNLDMLMSAGVLWRMQDRDRSIIAKRNNNGNFCSNNALLGTGCLSDASEDAFFNAPGSFAPNVDNGNLNYDKYDIAYAAFKVTSDLSLKWGDFGMFARSITVYDPANSGRSDSHPHNFDDRVTNPSNARFQNGVDTANQQQQTPSGLQPRSTKRTAEQEDVWGFDADIKDLYIYGDFELFDRFLTVKLGRQLVSWGEQLIFVPNSLNSINVPNLPRLRTPGLDLKELFDPVELAYVSYELNETASVEGFYQLKWRPIEIDPVGSFLSTVDVAGAGATYAMLSFGRATEDPDNLADSFAYNGNPGAAGDDTDGDGIADSVTPRDNEPGYAPNEAGLTVQDLSGRGCINPNEVIKDELRAQTLAGVGYNYERRGNSNRNTYNALAPGVDTKVTGGRTLCRAEDRRPDDDGQYGVSLKYFAEWLNDSELGFYYMNYHSRFPLVGFYASNANSGYDSFRGLDEDGNARDARIATMGVGGAVQALVTGNPNIQGIDNANLADDIETLFGSFNVVDTASIVIDYPENLNMYGFSFNTTIGDYSVSGEYAWHKNRPLQLDGTDLTYFAVAPAFAQLRRRNNNAGPLVGANGQLGGMVPSFVELYRGGQEIDPTNAAAGSREVRSDAARCPNELYLDADGNYDDTQRIGQPTNLCPGEYIKGYERFPVGQGDIVILEALSQTPFFADQWIRVLEIGFTKVFGMPGYEVDDFGQPVSGLLFSGAGVDTHPTLGRDEVRAGVTADGSTQLESYELVPQANTDEPVFTSALIQNPTRGTAGRPTSFSWGIRQLNLLTYNNLMFGYNFKPLIGFFWDINGTSPGPGGNHIEGRKTVLVGTDFEKGSFGGGIRYTWSTGGAQFNQERDRDNFQISFRYQF